jgi:hypothetical protein
VSKTKEIICRVGFDLRCQDATRGPRSLASKITPLNDSHITHASPRQSTSDHETYYAATDNDYV